MPAPAHAPGRASRAVLWGRAGVLGAAVLTTGSVSHLAGGGRLPGPVVMLVLLAVTVPLAARFLTARATAARLVVLVVAGQTVVHALLSMLAGHAGDRSAAPAAPTTPVPDTVPGRRTGSLLDHYNAAYPVPAPGGGDAGPGWVAHQLDHLVEQGPLMVAAHLAGAVALALFLAVGESSLWRLLLLGAARVLVARAAWRLVVAAADVRRGLALARVRVVAASGPPRSSQVLGPGAFRRRGPPALLAA